MRLYLSPLALCYLKSGNEPGNLIGEGLTFSVTYQIKRTKQKFCLMHIQRKKEFCAISKKKFVRMLFRHDKMKVCESRNIFWEFCVIVEISKR